VSAEDAGLHDAGILIRPDAAGGEVRFRGKRVHHGNEGFGPELLTARNAPHEVEVHWIAEDALLADHDGIVQTAHVVALDFRLHAVFFHRLGEVLQHAEGVFKNIVNKDFPRFAVHNAEVHGVGVE